MNVLPAALRQSLFIAGTDTGVGKTWVATRLLHALGGAGLRAGGMKPVAAGAEMTSHGLRNDDALDLQAHGAALAADGGQAPERPAAGDEVTELVLGVEERDVGEGGLERRVGVDDGDERRAPRQELTHDARLPGSTPEDDAIPARIVADGAPRSGGP